MTIGNLIFNLPNNIKRIIRNVEKTCKKLVNFKYALVFNTTCLNENILPTYTNIYIYIYIYIYKY